MSCRGDQADDRGSGADRAAECTKASSADAASADAAASCGDNSSAGEGVLVAAVQSGSPRVQSKRVRLCAQSALSSRRDLLVRYNITAIRDLRRLSAGTTGLLPFKVSAEPSCDEVTGTQTSHRRAVHRQRNKASAARRDTYLPGEAWSIDLTHQFPQDPDGNRIALKASDVATTRVRLEFMKGKSSVEVVAALERLRRKVAAEKRGITIH